MTDHDKTKERRQALALEILNPDFKQRDFADRWGVSETAISLDKKHPDFISSRIGHIVEKSITVLYEDLIGDDKKASREAARFFLERTNALANQTVDEGGDTTLSALKVLFGGADPEKEKMKQQIAELTARLDAVNGKGEVK